LMAPAPARAAMLTNPPSAPAISSYVVRAGDTLFSIAKKFSTSIEAIQRANNLGKRTALRVGQRLRIG
jgi:LysM repeat protein